VDITDVAERPQSQGVYPFKLERITGTLGAEVQGVDLGGKLSDELIRQLTAALVEHKVLVFRDQPITTFQHIALAKRFGPLEIHPFTQPSSGFANSDERPEVIRIESTADRPSAAATWHSDVTFRQTPSLASILRCRVAPAYGGDTVWADMEAAYNGLDETTREWISGLTAIHDWEAFRKNMRRSGVPQERIDELVREHPPAEHPVVRTHPVSGRKILYVNLTFTAAIKGLPNDESQALLRRLSAQAHRPEYQMRLRWRPDTIAMWDNRSTQHYGVGDFHPQHRLMERVTVAGDRPF